MVFYIINIPPNALSYHIHMSEKLTTKESNIQIS